MDKFLPFLYEKKKIDKFEQQHLYQYIMEYPLDKTNNKENEDEKSIIIDIL